MNKRISNADTSSASLSVDLETAVSSTASCVLIDQTRYTDGPEAVQAWLQHTTMSLAIELHQIDGANVSENTLLRRLKLNHHVADESVSPYRQLTSIIDNGERSVLVVHQADQLADKGLHIVARLARYIVRSESNWKILLIGDGKRFGDLDLFQLPIDLIFEQGKSKLAAKGIAAQHATDPYQSNSQLPAILISVALLGAGAAILLSPALTGSREDAGSIEQPAYVPSVVLESTRDEPQNSNPKGINSEAESSNKLDDSQWLSNEEFEAIIARLNEPESTTAKKVSAQDKKGARRSRNSIVRMSSNMSEAVRDGDARQIATLVSSGEDPNGRNQELQTPLILASLSGHSGLAGFLLDRKADVDLRDTHGRTAIYYAAVGGHEGLARQLLRHGADINLSSNLNKTPLMAAVHNNYVSLAKLLLDNGANINIQDHSGWNALFYAVWNDNIEMVDLLLQHNPNLRQVDNNGNSIEAIARAKKNPDVIARLKLS